MRMLGLYCSVDAFWQAMAPPGSTSGWLAVGSSDATRLSPSVIMTVLNLFPLLHKRALIESVNDQLENVCQIDHSHYRSPYTLLAHLVAGLIAYRH